MARTVPGPGRRVKPGPRSPATPFYNENNAQRAKLASGGPDGWRTARRVGERTPMTAAPTEMLEFKTELKQLLHIITHSLYSNKEIFLRELISNASDAINKIRFDSLQHEELLEGNKDWKIKVSVDKQAGTLTVSDNGIGMSRDSAVENLGTIAKSGTRAFLEALKSKDVREQPELIGQFGVGFYSAFMVA